MGILMPFIEFLQSRVRVSYMSERININKFLFSIIFWILLFSSCWDSLFNNRILEFMGKHIDEVLVFIFLGYVLLNIQYVIARKTLILVYWIVFLMCGILSNIVFGYANITYALIDAILISSRFIIAYLAMWIYLNKNSSSNSISDAVYNVTCICVGVLFVLLLHELLFSPFFPVGDFRYFMHGQQLFFPHPTYLSGACATILIYLGYKKEKKYHFVFMIMVTLVGISTLRSKAIAFFVIYWIIYLCLMVIEKKCLFVLLIIGGIIVVLLGWAQLQYNFVDENIFAPRSILMSDGLKLMAHFFPIGTGFATFGSSMAATHYSVIYTQLGYVNYDGMNPSNTSFLMDTFWPIVMAQTGVVGTIAVILLIIELVVMSIKKMNNNKNSGIAMLLTIIYMIIASIAETSFFNPMSFAMFTLFAIYDMEA